MQTVTVTAIWLCVNSALVFLNVVQMLQVGCNCKHVSSSVPYCHGTRSVLSRSLALATTLMCFADKSTKNIHTAKENNML